MATDRRTLGAAAVAAILAGAVVQLLLLRRGFYSISFDEAGRVLDDRTYDEVPPRPPRSAPDLGRRRAMIAAVEAGRSA